MTSMMHLTNGWEQCRCTEEEYFEGGGGQQTQSEYLNNPKLWIAVVLGVPLDEHHLNRA
jgi:hypothetical protein